MSANLEIKALTGRAIADHVPALAHLRIEVFREFPYLYDGDLDYEAEYLRHYVESPHSIVVAVFNGDTVVGASTALPMIDADPAFRQPFIDNGYNIDTVFYLGESVLLKPYRGRGLGVRFFEEREAHARRIGEFVYSAFCAVDRPENHPRRPADYMPLDRFWNKRGYTRRPELKTAFEWKDLDDAEETAKSLTFWVKSF